MPLLKYRCAACDEVTEQLVPLSAVDTARCEKCGGELTRVYEGACLFGMAGSSAGRGACAGSCGTCSSHSHAGGCQCGSCQ